MFSRLLRSKNLTTVSNMHDLNEIRQTLPSPHLTPRNLSRVKEARGNTIGQLAIALQTLTQPLYPAELRRQLDGF